MEYSKEFINRQEQINTISKVIFRDVDIQSNINNDIPELAWQKLHSWLIEKLIQTISGLGNLDSLPESIENKTLWINSFIAFVSKEIKEGKLDEYAIIPNQKGNFCYKQYLSKDIGIPEELKSIRAAKFGVQLKDELLHKEIDSITITREKSIYSVIELINSIFKENQFEDGESDLDFAIFIIHLLPKETSQLLHNS